jgi:heme iron utilization protein
MSVGFAHNVPNSLPLQPGQIHMPIQDSASRVTSTDAAAVAAGRRLLRMALKGSLATVSSAAGGHPFASLVLVASEPDGTPVFLISRLAVHTQNLATDARASLLIDGTDGLADPLTGGRLTLVGHARPTPSPTARSRFLARHPSAQTYAGFPDFAMYALEISGAHYVGGFGRIVDLTTADLLRPVQDAQDLVAAEAGIIAHMNEDHSDAVALYATELAQCAAGDWRLTGVDADGIDLLHRSNAARVEFPTRVRNPGEARAALVAMAKQARDRQAHNAS